MEATTQRMPYAPSSTVVDLIQRFRERGLPEPVTAKSLQQVGISEGNAPRTIQALKLLELLDDEGNPTEAFTRLRRASTAEYPKTLAEIVRGAYHPIFSIVEPAEDDLTAIDDAFRHYEPMAQWSRMVRLFLGLCEEAEIIPKDRFPARGQSQQPRQQRSSSRRPANKQTRTKRPKATAEKATETAEGEEAPRETPREPEDAVHDYRPISVLFQQLPKNGRWTQKRRNLWMRAMASAVDLAVEVEDEPEVVYEGEVMPELELES